MRRVRSQWREYAAAWARGCWHVAEWRYFDVRRATRAEIVAAAAHQVRWQLSAAYNRSHKHPRSRKAVEQVRELAKELASIGLWLLEQR